MNNMCTCVVDYAVNKTTPQFVRLVLFLPLFFLLKGWQTERRHAFTSQADNSESAGLCSPSSFIPFMNDNNQFVRELQVPVRSESVGQSKGRIRSIHPTIYIILHRLHSNAVFKKQVKAANAVMCFTNMSQYMEVNKNNSFTYCKRIIQKQIHSQTKQHEFLLPKGWSQNSCSPLKHNQDKTNLTPREFCYWVLFC